MSEDLELTNEVPVESVLQLFLMFAAKAQVNVVKPLMMVILLVYQNTVIGADLYDPDVYRRWYLYALLLAALIPLQVLVDSFSLYLVDLLHTYNVLDYLRFCVYRFKNRRDDWILNSAVLDTSLGLVYRSTDVMCFSSQFHFCVGVNAWGGILALVGFQIMTLNGYNLFEDPFSLGFIFLLLLIGRVGRFGCKLVKNVFKIWAKPRPIDQKLFNTKMNLENYMMKEWNIFEHDAVRHSLVTHKKEWIVNRLDKFVSQEQFKEDNGFLIRVHKKLDDIIRKEEIEEAKKVLITNNTFVASVHPRSASGLWTRKASSTSGTKS